MKQTRSLSEFSCLSGYIPDFTLTGFDMSYIRINFKPPLYLLSLNTLLYVAVEFDSLKFRIVFVLIKQYLN